MAGLALGNLLGAISQATTALSEDRSVKQFIDVINKFGLQVKNNFEVNFSGLQDATFFIQTISLPQMTQSFTNLKYAGRTIDVPLIFDWDHTFSMTVLNDAQGWIYSALQNFIMNDTTNTIANSGYTMTIKALTGDEKYAGALVTLRGVRFESISGLDWGHSENNYQTFTVSGKLIDYTYTPGALAQVAGWAGAVDQLLGK